MPQVIGCKLQLNPIRRKAIVHRHDARIVDQDINSRDILPRVHRSRRVAYRLQRAQIEVERASLYVGIELGDGVGGVGCAGDAAAGEDEEAGGGFGNGCGEDCAEAAGGDACDQDGLPFDAAGELGDEL